MAITWTTERRQLKDLQPWARNPRQIRTAHAERLAESVDTFGQVETLAIGPENEIYNGHQRLTVLADRHGLDYEVDVRVASRSLSEKERERLTVYLHKGAAGEWDFDILADEFEIDELLDWGFTPQEFGLDNEIDPYDEWQGMPEFEQEDIGAHRTIKVHFLNEDDAQKFSELLGQSITDKTKYLWYPQQEPENLQQYSYVDAA